MLLILCLLFVKHWYVDFVSQRPEQIAGKGIYGNLHGIEHSFWHGVFTALVFGLVVPIYLSLILGLIDMVLHYHIDYVKMRYGEKDISNPKFWNHLGLDQLAHQITYIVLTAIAIGYEWRST